MTTHAKNMTDVTLGSLTYIQRQDDGLWSAQCVCGNICYVRTGAKSCGCLTRKHRTEQQRARNAAKALTEPVPDKWDCAELLRVMGY